MTNLRMIIVVVLTISVASCATPPGKLTNSDFLSREIVLDFPISKALNQLHQGFRYCGPESGGVIFVTHHGVHQCMPVQEDGSVLCDMFIGRVVLGRIELNPSSTGTSAILRVRTYVANKDNILKSWEMFLRGLAKDVCPEN